MKFFPTRNRSRAAASILGIALLAASLSACTTPAETPVEEGTSEPIKVLVVPTLDSVLAYVAEEEGFFDEQGLDVTVEVGQGGTAIIDAILAGEAQIGIANYGTLVSGAANGLPLSVVSPLTLGGPDDFTVWVQPDSGIETVADLEGKSIGVIATGSLADLLVNVQLDGVGLSAEDVTYVAVPAPNFVSALTSGQVDAIFVDVLTAHRAEAEGAQLLTSGFAGESELLPLGGFVADNTWIDAHPDVAAKFQAAIAQAAELVASDRSVAEAIVPTYSAITAEEVTDLVLPTWATDQSVADLQRVADLMLKYGMLTEPFDVSTIVAS